MAHSVFVLVQISVMISVILCLELVGLSKAAPEGRIINGNPTLTNQFPWHMLLNCTRIDNVKRYCGGTLIAPNFVLTAASCIENATNIKVGAGIISFFNAHETQSSSLYRLHPSYDFKSGVNDIAIIKLDREFTYRDNARSIMLPGNSQVNNSFVNQQCYFSGFGMTNQSNFRNQSKWMQ